MEKEDFVNSSYVEHANPAPSIAPTVYIEPNATVVDFAEVENEHETDAITVLLMNVTIIGCLLLAYYVRQHRIYHLPERCDCADYFFGGRGMEVKQLTILNTSILSISVLAP